jgi:hypothetical protein
MTFGKEKVKVKEAGLGGQEHRTGLRALIVAEWGQGRMS